MMLEDKVCVIAGVASFRGIGFATAALFARHGAKLVVTDRAMDKSLAAAIHDTLEQQTAGPIDLIGVACDITRGPDCSALRDQALQHFGRIDALVNCAGIVDAKPFLEIEPQELDTMLAVNLKGAFNLAQSVLATMVTAGSGAIVNVASVAGQRGGGLVGGAHYAASKGGLISLTKTIAREFGPGGIRANVVSPSMTDTGMLDGNISAERYADLVAQIPLRRAGLPADIAGACLFLASDLSGYITGATIDVNGGSHIH